MSLNTQHKIKRSINNFNVYHGNDVSFVRIYDWKQRQDFN